MIQNKYHGSCCECGKILKPFEGFIRRAPRGDGWLFKHESCVKKLKPMIGETTQPVRQPETRICSECDRQKPVDQFNGFISCTDCRNLRAIEARKYVNRVRPVR